MILGDETYQAIVDQIMQHDLTGYDVYLVGSVTKRNARDLDVAIVGPWDYERLAAIFESLSGVKYLDLSWCANAPETYSWYDAPRRVANRKWIGLDASPRKKSSGQLFGGFIQNNVTLPTVKSKMRKYIDITPILIIQNGEQIYF